MSATRPPIRRVLVLVGGKLIGIDSILPVIMQMRAEVPSLRATFLLLAAATRPIIERNYVLRRAVEATGEVRILGRGDGKWTSRTAAAAELARQVLSLRATPTLLLSAGDLGRFPFSSLAAAARAGGGRAMVYCKPAYPGNPALNYAQASKIEGRDMRFRDDGDAFVVYYPTQTDDYKAYIGAPAIVVGMPRVMPAWRRHLDDLAAEGILDDAGRDLSEARKPVILVFYCGPAKIPFQHDDVRETFLRLLEVLADEAPEASIVVKPHPICDLKLLATDIAASRRPDVRVSHAHPQLLARIAQASISLNGSNVMNDMYVEGVPVIETTRYRPDILAHGPSLYPNPGRIDASDPDVLRRVLRSVGGGAADLPRPDPDPLAWPVPPSVSDLLIGGR